MCNSAHAHWCTYVGNLDNNHYIIVTHRKKTNVHYSEGYHILLQKCQEVISLPGYHIQLKMKFVQSISLIYVLPNSYQNNGYQVLE